MYRLLSYLVKTGILCEIRNIAVHLTIHLYVLHYITAISLQSAIEIMQIMNTAHLACRSIKQFRRYSLRQRVSLLSVLLIAGNEVITVLLYHSIQFRNLVRRILQIRIHRYHHISLCLLETTEERRTLSVVAAELYSFHFRMIFSQFLYHVPGIVRRAVVHEDNFKCETLALHNTLNPSIQLWQRLILII